MKPIERLDRALSIRQPFVELILTGRKTAEYRGKPTANRGRVYLYAARSVNDITAYPLKEALKLPRGLIVGSVEIVDCKPCEWGDGFAWLLAEPTRYAEPFRARGTPQPAFWFPTF